MRGFERESDGSIRLWPVEDFKIILGAGMTVGLWVEYGLDPDEGGGRRSVQVALTPEQARALSRTLQSAADEATEPPAPGAPLN